MANPWFKMYADLRVQSMSEIMQRRWAMLLVLHCSGELDGLNDAEICCGLRISQRQWTITKALFVEKGFIDDELNVLGWDTYEPLDDDGQSGDSTA